MKRHVALHRAELDSPSYQKSRSRSIPCTTPFIIRAVSRMAVLAFELYPIILAIPRTSFLCVSEYFGLSSIVAGTWAFASYGLIGAGKIGFGEKLGADDFLLDDAAAVSVPVGFRGAGVGLGGGVGAVASDRIDKAEGLMIEAAARRVIDAILAM